MFILTILLTLTFAYTAFAEITLMPFIEVPSLKITISDSENELDDIEYKPNTRTHLGLSLIYKKFSIGGSFQLSQNDDEKVINLETKYFDFHGLIFYKNILFGYSYQHYQGFYLELNPFKFSKTERPDIEAVNMSIYGVYSLDKDKLDLEKAYNFKKLDIISSGSWLTKILLNRFELSSTDPIVENFLANRYTSINGLTKLTQSSISSLWGYGYLYSKEDYKVYGEIMLGLGLQRLAHTKVNGNFENVITNSSQRASVILSSNSINHNYGIKMVTYVVNSALADTDVSNLTTSGFLFYTYSYTK